MSKCIACGVIVTSVFSPSHMDWIEVNGSTSDAVFDPTRHKAHRPLCPGYPEGLPGISEVFKRVHKELGISNVWERNCEVLDERHD